MKKKGFTLIELIITLNILVLITTITSTSIKAYKNRKTNININKYTYEIKTLLSYSKSYCRKYNANGNLFINIKENSFKFSVIEKDNPIEKTIYIPNGFSVISNYKGNSFYVSKEGYIKEAGTISLIYNGKTVKEIKIGVGNDIIGITEGDIIE
ncbi:prepilin-type N-terminal cleavage/methylation domain-containing protein [Clostridium sp.]|uniref:prepilin-type N-terminal cleavage/methylation domain-containing protein n=1 Tax=Clostridium sp. TaxID=1506 RepID=UPI002618B7CB|nr:prepilin-type N-terminal cleavage/methylation domain-containing protein [Clostridium sp.]